MVFNASDFLQLDGQPHIMLILNADVCFCVAITIKLTVKYLL